VDLDVCRVLELLRDPGTRVRGRQLLRALDRPLHPALARRELEGGAVGLHQPPALDRHGVRHDQDQPVALHGSHHGKTDAGVARGGLDDGASRPQSAIGLGGLHHGQGDAVLHRAAGVGPLRLDPDLGTGKQAANADMRRVADRLKHAVGLHRALLGLRVG
jgi:hypothetical protein